MTVSLYSRFQSEQLQLAKVVEGVKASFAGRLGKLDLSLEDFNDHSADVVIVDGRFSEERIKLFCAMVGKQACVIVMLDKPDAKLGNRYTRAGASAVGHWRMPTNDIGLLIAHAAARTHHKVEA